MNSILDYYRIDDRLATSGQPTSEQFQLIADDGYQAVINLAMSTSTNALVDEEAIVTSLGMLYIHLPVVWENPKLEDVEQFFAIMRSLINQKVWVHCAKNMRVSCFIYFWQKYMLQLPEEQSQYPMNQIWQPEGVWRQLIDQVAVSFSNT